MATEYFFNFSQEIYLLNEKIRENMRTLLILKFHCSKNSVYNRKLIDLFLIFS